MYEVTHRGKPYALKIIQNQWLEDETQMRRMALEGELLSRIRHPYIVDVFETGVGHGGLALRRAQGALRARCERGQAQGAAASPRAAAAPCLAPAGAAGERDRRPMDPKEEMSGRA